MKWGRDVEARFWDNVIKGAGCWEWRGAKNVDGYGVLYVDCKEVRAHRHSFAIHGGVLKEGEYVLHHCDNRSCVRPDHLYAGNHADNMRDMSERGRVRQGDRQGEKNAGAVLADSQVAYIKLLGAHGFGSRRIARWYGVSMSAVGRILYGGGWPHIAAAELRYVETEKAGVSTRRVLAGTA